MTCKDAACGLGAECREHGGQIECSCVPGFAGNPYVQCLGKIIFILNLQIKLIFFFNKKISMSVLEMRVELERFVSTLQDAMTVDVKKATLGIHS